MKRRFRAAHKKSLIDELAVNIQTDASEALNRLAQQIAKPTADLKNSYLRLKTRSVLHVCLRLRKAVFCYALRIDVQSSSYKARIFSGRLVKVSY